MAPSSKPAYQSGSARIEGKPCRRDVEADFLMKPGKKYWRLQAIDNPCDAAADYVDLFAR